MVVSPCRVLRSADARALTSSASIGSLWSATSAQRLCAYSCTRFGAAGQGWRPPGCDHRVVDVRPHSMTRNALYHYSCSIRVSLTRRRIHSQPCIGGPEWRERLEDPSYLPYSDSPEVSLSAPL